MSRLIDNGSDRLEDDIFHQLHFPGFLKFLPLRKQKLQTRVQNILAPAVFRIIGNPPEQRQKSRHKVIASKRHALLFPAVANRGTFSLPPVTSLQASETFLQHLSRKVFLHLFLGNAVRFQKMPAQQIPFHKLCQTRTHFLSSVLSLLHL